MLHTIPPHPPSARDVTASRNLEVNQVVESLFSISKFLRCLTNAETAFWRKEIWSIMFSDAGSQPKIADRSGTNISADWSFFGEPPGCRRLKVALRVLPTALNKSPDLHSKPVLTTNKTIDKYKNSLMATWKDLNKGNIKD